MDTYFHYPEGILQRHCEHYSFVTVMTCSPQLSGIWRQEACAAGVTRTASAWCKAIYFVARKVLCIDLTVNSLRFPLGRRTSLRLVMGPEPKVRTEK